MLTSETIDRLARQTQFSAYQIQQYVERVAADEAVMEGNIREADMFDIDIDLLGR